MAKDFEHRPRRLMLPMPVKDLDDCFAAGRSLAELVNCYGGCVRLDHQGLHQTEEVEVTRSYGIF
ncbi:UNVERIFIED_ORG: hypothetical protein EDF86_2576 [Pseudomonas psychrophila]